MKARKDILILILSVAMFMLIIGAPFMIILLNGVDFKSVSAVELPKVGFVYSTTYADENNMISLDVALEGQIPEGQSKVTVSYHTESGSAIAGVDFNATSGTVELTQDNITAKIRVSVRNKNRFLVKEGNKDYSRYFTVVLDKATNAVIDQTKKVAEAHLSGGTQLALSEMTSKGNTISYLSEYNNIQHTYQSSYKLTDEHFFKSWTETDLTLNNATTRNWVSDYINTGLAQAYGLPLVGSVTTETIRHTADFTATFGNRQMDYSDRGKESGLTDANAQSKIPGVLMRLDVDFHFFADTGDNGDAWNEDASIYYYEGSNPYDRDDDVWDIYRSNSWIDKMNGRRFYSFSNFGSGSTGRFREGYYFLIRPYQNILDMRMTMYDCSSVYDKRVDDIEFDMALKDFSAPRLLDTYIDDSALATTGKLRLIMRYNEPVYVPESRSVGVKMGNSVTVNYFKYVGGNYSDTQFYEFDTNGTPNFRGNITDNYVLSDSGNVKDLALLYTSNQTAKNNDFDVTSLNTAGKHIISKNNTNINYRNPVVGVDVEKTSTFSSKYQLELSLGAYVSSDLSSTTGVGDGTIYYTWSTSEAGLGNDASRYAFSGAYSDYVPLNVSLAGKEELRLNGSKQNIGGEWIMKYDACSFVIDDVTYIMDRYDADKGNSFHVQGQSNEYTFDGVGKESFFIDNKTFIFEGSILTIERAGTYYLHAYGVSEYNLSKSATFGPYKIDGSNPVITAEVPNNDRLRVKLFEISYYDRPIITTGGATASNTSGVDNVSVTVKTTVGDVFTKNIVVGGTVTKEYGKVFTATDATGENWEYYSSVNVTEDEDTGKLDPLIYGLMENATRENLTITFTVTDKCGNTFSTEPVEYIYDMREGFGSTISLSIDGVPVETPLFKANKIPVYDAQGKELKVTINTEDTNLGQIFDCLIEDENGDFTSIYHNPSAESGVIPEMSFVISEAGYYQFTPQIQGRVAENDYTKISSRYRFYVTNGLSDETLNYQTTKQQLVLSNSVYQISGGSTPVQFSYLNAGKKLSHYNYGATYDEVLGKYVGGSQTPTFSDPNVAKKYFEYMEYQDLYLICLTDTIANALNNGGSPEYQKADDEPRAMVGQLWVRYKRSTWTIDSKETSWVYYFYDQSGSANNGIDVNVLNKNEHFTSAVDAVVKTIMSYGKIVNLISGDNITLEGAPRVADVAMHYNKEEAFVTACGTMLSTKITFTGDPNIYKNSIKTVDEKVLPLATNLILKADKHTQLYFRSSGVSSASGWGELTDSNSGWVRLDVKEGEVLRNALFDYSTDIYTVLELGDNGVNCFEIFVDKTLPDVTIKLGDGEEIQHLDGAIDKIYGKSVEFIGLAGEYDEQAYVGVFSHSGVLDKVYYANTLSGLVLANNSYKIQIGDRSGNILVVNLYLSTTTLDLTLEENEFMDGVTVTVRGRTRDEILRYEVYCNNQLVSREFPQNVSLQYLRQTFRDPGIYSVYVEDVYGNKETRELNYKRPVPNIVWSYLSGNTYVDYNANNVVCMTVVPDEKYTGMYNVYSSALLRFRLDVSANASEASWEIIGASEGRDYTVNSVTKSVSMLTLTPFELHVFYTDYPDNYVTYNVMIDNDAPHISATYIGSGYAYDDVDISDYPELELGDRPSLLSLEYYVTPGKVRDVENGEIIDGNLVTVSVTDGAGVRSVTVEVNGSAPQTVQLTDDGKFKIDDYGEYVIRAVDTLGNPSVFRFNNTREPFTEATLDGEDISCGIGKTYYGNDVLRLVELTDGTTEVIVKYDEGRFYGFYRYENGSLREGWYEVVEGETEGELSYAIVISEEALLNVNSDGFEYGKPYVLSENEYYRLEIVINEDNNPEYRVTCLRGTLDVETLLTVGNSKTPDFFSVQMSKELSDVAVYSGAEEVETNKDGKMIYVGEALWFDTVTDSKVTSVKIARSDSETFTDYLTLFTANDSGKIYYTAEEDGLYSVKVENVYGNVTEYLFSLSKSFFISATVTYEDGAQAVYVYEDGLTIYLNNKVSVTAFAPNVTFTVNGEQVEATETDNSRTVTLTRGNLDMATYEVVARDEGGVERRFSFVIGTDKAFAYFDGWLTGYNEDALLKSEDYTNKKLSVVWDESIYQIFVEKDGKTSVIYDLLSQDRVTEYSRFTDCVGNDGDGDYTVIFRNKYGDAERKTIHYCSTPTLKLSRSTLAGGYSEEYDLERALSDGFYSSNVLVFDSTANYFNLTVTTGDGNVIVPTKYPYMLEFDSESGYGAFEYKINYVDAYGFKYSFIACLSRQDLLFGTAQMELVLVEDTYYTRDNVAITFADSLTCTVSKDGKAPTAYKSGNVLRADGTFRFEITDVAGNLKTFTVVHDSVIKYTVSSSTTGSVILKGGVTNAESVLFRISEGDTGYLKHVIYNGETLENFTGNTFELSGHWELLIEDRIGNTSYFEFYLLNHCVSEFAYTAPNGYTVSEVWLTERDGTRRITPYSGDSVHLKNEGNYAVVMTSKLDNIAVNFTVTVDCSLPTAKLVGCEDGEETAREVTLEGLQKGDVVEVYMNGELLQKIRYSSVYDTPKFSDGGEYTVTITNLAGVSKTYSFTKKFIANAMTSVIIIICCIVVMGGVFVGLLYRNNSKTDR